MGEPANRADRRGIDPRWAPLALLLAALGVAVLVFDRAAWPGFVGDETTYLMAAESLAFDGDLYFTPADYERFVEHWRQPPEGLILQSGDGGATLAYSKPFFYPLLAAPFVRLAPVRGPLLANVLLLALAALAAARALAPALGRAAPLWVAVFLFGSVAFAYAFWAHADVFLFAAVALAFALLFAPARGEGGSSPGPGRALAAGLALGLAIFSRPFYLPLVLPALLALPRGRRAARAGALLAGMALVALAGAGIHKATGGSWTAYGGERRAFYSYTGFPAVDFPTERWGEAVAATGGGAGWAEAGRPLDPKLLDARLAAWNALFLVAGRHVGLLPYFLPAFVVFLGRPRGAARWALAAAALLSMAAFFVYRPFNFYGGGGAIANRYFLPLYAALWFLPSRPIRARWALAATVLAAPFLWPLWSEPGGFLRRSDGSYRYVSRVAEALLPFESSQSHLQPSHGPDMSFEGLWIRFANAAPRARRGGDTIHLRPQENGDFLLGLGTDRRKIDLRFVGKVPERLEVRGARLAGGGSSGPARRRTRLVLDPPRSFHPMWWRDRPLYLYLLRLRFEGAAAESFTFRLAPAGGKLQKTGRTARDTAGEPPLGTVAPSPPPEPDLP